MIHELLDDSDGVIVSGQPPPPPSILAYHPETDYEYFDQSIGGPAGPHHLYHQPRWPRGYGEDHVVLMGEFPVDAGVTGVHKADAWVEPNFVG